MAKLFLFLCLTLSLSISMVLTSRAEENLQQLEELEPVNSEEMLAKFDGLTVEQEREKQRVLRERESPKLWEDSIDQDLIDRLSQKQRESQSQNQNEI